MQRGSRNRCCANELKYDRRVKHQREKRNTSECQCCQCGRDNSSGKRTGNVNNVNENSYNFSEHSERSNNERYNSDSSYCSRRRSPSSCKMSNENSPLISLEDLDDIKRCFHEVDRDCDGWINAAELCCFMQLRETPITYANAENIVFNSDTCYHYSINRNQVIYLAGKYGVSTQYSVNLTEQEYNFALLSLQTPTTVENYLQFAYNYLSDRNKARFEGTVNYFEEKAEREYQGRLCEEIRSRNNRKNNYKNCYTSDTSYGSEFQRQSLAKERSQTNFKNISSAGTLDSHASKQPKRVNKSETYLDFNSLRRNWEEKIQKELLNIRKSETFRRTHGGDEIADKYCGKPNPRSQNGNCTEIPNGKPDSSNSSLVKLAQSGPTETKSNNNSSISLSKSGSSIKPNESSTSRKSKSGKINEQYKKASKKESEKLSEPKSSKSEYLGKQANSSSKIKLPLKSKSENSINSKTKSKKSFFNNSGKSEVKSSKNNSVEDLSKAKGDSSQTSLKSKTGSKEKKSKRSKSTSTKGRKNPEELSVLPIPLSQSPNKSRTQVQAISEKSDKGSSRSGRKQKSKMSIKADEKSQNIQKNIGNSKSVLEVSKKLSPRLISSSRSFTSTNNLQPNLPLSDKEASARNKSAKQINVGANAMEQTSNLPNVKSNKKSKSKNVESNLTSLPAPVKSLPTFSTAGSSLNSKRSASSAPPIPPPPPLPPIPPPPPLPPTVYKSKSQTKSKKKVPKSVSGPNIPTFSTTDSSLNSKRSTTAPPIPPPPPLPPTVYKSKSPTKSKKKVSKSVSGRKIPSSSSKRLASSAPSGVSVENIAKEAKIGKATSIKGKKKVTFGDQTKKTASKGGFSTRMTM